MKIMKLIYILGLCLLFTSCLDVEKQEHLKQLTALDKRVDSIQVEFELLKKDTISEILYAMKMVNNTIKENIGDDTIDLATAKNLEKFSKIYRKLSSLEGYNEKILFGSQEAKNSIENLHKDIQEGNGERVNYEKFVAFETKKVKDLHNLLVDMEKLQKEGVTEYVAVHKDVENFANTLINN